MINFQKYVKPIALLVITGFSWSLTFVFVYAGIQYGPVSTNLLLTLLCSAILMCLFFGKQALETGRLIFPGTTEWISLKSDAAVFIMACFSLLMTFFLQSIKRYSYAPSGSDSVFLLATVPLFAVLLAYFLSKEKLTVGRLAGAATALLGTIAIVGNWERPSSFSPFSMFRLEETLLLLSAASLAIFLVMIKRLISKYSPPALATATICGSALLALVPAVIIDKPVNILSIVANSYMFYIAFGVFGVAIPVVAMTELAASYDAGKASSAIALMPVFATLMIGIEKGFGISLLPTPFEWMPIIVGMVIVILGVLAMWSS